MSSGCGDVLSLADLQTAKKHQIFEAEVITGKSGGVATGADIDYATNQVTGQTQKTMPAILRDIGFEPASFDFTTGGTLTSSDRNKAVLWPMADGGDGDWYYWEGALPKVIPAASTPSSTGGVAEGAWRPVGDIQLRAQLASSDDGFGDMLVAVKQPYDGSVLQTQHNKNSRILDLYDFNGLPSNADNTSALNSALSAINSMGGGLLRINIPGVYLISGTITVYANTHIVMDDGVVIRRNYTTGNSMVNLAHNSASNVTISGGEFDGNAQNMGDTAFNIISSTLNTDLKFIGVKFSNVCDYHCIDIAGWKRVVIRDCVFSGFKLVDPLRNYSEAIQLDPGDISIGTPTQCNDLTVDNCIVMPNANSSLGSFGALVGNHTNSYGIQDNNIKIINNTTEGCLFAGVRVFNWRNYLIAGNTFRDSTGRGVHVTPYPNSTKPQGSRHGRIVNNNFINVRNPVLLAAATWPFTDASDVWHDYIEIVNNSMELSETLAYGIDARWCRNIVVSGNTGSGGLGLMSMRFPNKFSVKNNTWSNATNNGIWIAETDATTFIGTGLTALGTIEGNVFDNIAYNGIHINCKANGVTIRGNTMNGVSTAATSRSGITIDSAASNVIISNNCIMDSGASIKPNVGIVATATCTNVHMADNISYGGVSPINNQATGNSVLVHTGPNSPITAGIGAPVGSQYRRVDGSASTSFYVKESGTNSIGWVAK